MQMCDTLITVMYKNQNIVTKIAESNPVRKLTMAAIGCGMVLSSLHGAGAGYHGNISSVDFSTRVIRELHTHSDIQLQPNRVVVDPRALRSARNDDERLAAGDGMCSSWDVYYT